MELTRARHIARHYSEQQTFWYVREVTTGDFQPYAHSSNDVRTVATFMNGEDVTVKSGDYVVTGRSSRIYRVGEVEGGEGMLYRTWIKDQKKAQFGMHPLCMLSKVDAPQLDEPTTSSEVAAMVLNTALDATEAPAPLTALRHHVTGAIERGEGVAVTEQAAPHVKVEQVRQLDTLARHHSLPTYSELAQMLQALTFVAETVAHTRGLEREILPTTDKAREMLNTINGGN